MSVATPVQRPFAVIVTVPVDVFSSLSPQSPDMVDSPYYFYCYRYLLQRYCLYLVANDSALVSITF